MSNSKIDISSTSEKITELINNPDKIPNWAQTLLECFSDLVTEYKNFNTLSQRVDCLESEKSVQATVNTKLHEENDRLWKEINKIKCRVDDNEQRSRNQCLLIHGITEMEKENTDNLVIGVISEDVGIPIAIEDIQRSHRLGPFKNKNRNTRSTKPRPIIVRFTDMRKRIEVFRNKKQLKGKKIVITENLTFAKHQLLLEALEKLGKNKVWSIEGRITTKIDNKLVIIESSDHLARLEATY